MYGDVALILLQTMLDVAYQYSIRWRFKFNADKSSIICVRAYGNNLNLNFIWKLGSEIISVDESYNHLGVIINNKCTLSDRIMLACEKGRKAYFGISNLVLTFANPLSVVHLYRTVVRSSVLYGCELWNNLSSKDIQRLNTFQHYISKHAQSLPAHTRSAMAESMVGLLPIMSEVDIRKLLFFGLLTKVGLNTRNVHVWSML